MRKLFLMASLGLVGIACSSKPNNKTDGGTDGGTMVSCFDDTDCPMPGSNLFRCNQGSCIASCRTKDDCSADKRGEYAIDYCKGGLGCECDEFRCVGRLCASDDDCGSQVCRNGACTTAPAATEVASCTVVPDYAVLKAGTSQKFNVFMSNANGEAVVVDTGITWTAGAGGTVVNGTGTQRTTTFTAGNAAVAAGAGVTATVNGKTCSATVETVSGAVGATELAVIVVDELSGRPIVGATVVASNNAGDQVGEKATTGSNGYAKLTNVTGSEVNVTVFSASHSYLTIANYALDNGASRFLYLTPRRHLADKYGGQKGTFAGVPQTSDLHVGFGGMSLAGSITDLSLGQLLGTSFDTRIKIASIDTVVGLPAGVYLGISDQQLKNRFEAQGLAGVCSAAKGGSTAAEQGTCGTRTAWAFGGDVSIGDLPIQEFTDKKYEDAFKKIIPLLRRFNSSVIRDLEFSLKPTPLATDGSPQFKDAGSEDFTEKDHSYGPPGAVPVGFNFVAQVPDLPLMSRDAGYPEGVVILGGVNVPGRGVVPLGLGMGVNLDNDAKIDPSKDLKEGVPNLVRLRMAPAHHGVEGADYGFLTLAAPIKALLDGAGLSLSGVFARPEKNKLTFDPTGAAPLVVSGPFPAVPFGAKYDFIGRTFKFPSFTTTNNPATLVRVSFNDNFEHKWIVLGDPAKIATSGFKLPDAATYGQVDRTFANANKSSRSNIVIQTIRLSEDAAQKTPALMSYKTLVEANSTNSDRLTDYLVGFSLADYGRPSISIDAFKEAVAKGSAVTVKVKSFNVGTNSVDDGYVKMTFTGGADCPEVMGQMSDAKGNVAVTLPPNCSGTLMATARLVDLAGVDVNPPVSTVVAVTVKP